MLSLCENCVSLHQCCETACWISSTPPPTLHCTERQSPWHEMSDFVSCTSLQSSKGLCLSQLIALCLQESHCPVIAKTKEQILFPEWTVRAKRAQTLHLQSSCLGRERALHHCHKRQLLTHAPVEAQSKARLSHVVPLREQRVNSALMESFPCSRVL